MPLTPRSRLPLRLGLQMAVCMFVAVGNMDTAQARIACRNGYQSVGGNMIATPYCQDALLAKVAREYGMAASDARVRNNPNYKREVCRFVGHDIRVSEHCLQETPGFRGRAR